MWPNGSPPEIVKKYGGLGDSIKDRFSNRIHFNTVHWTVSNYHCGKVWRCWRTCQGQDFSPRRSSANGGSDPFQIVAKHHVYSNGHNYFRCNDVRSVGPVGKMEIDGMGQRRSIPNFTWSN